MKRIYHTGCFYLPAQKDRLSQWSVVACDQYTSQPDVWHGIEETVGNAPSTLRLILPEVYLSNAVERVKQIHQCMHAYLVQGVLEEAVHNGLVLTERECAGGNRIGLVMTVDLDAYDFGRDSSSPIRPTEGTVVERLPPRMAVRRGAPLECSHILLLCNDAEQTVIEPLYRDKACLEPLYDVQLMTGGGRLRGWKAAGDRAEQVFRALDVLAEKTGDGILFAAGDGNHSLATAKACWEEIKKTLSPEEAQRHPARFATVELINIYDPALVFEPIHRVIAGRTGDEVLRILEKAQPEPVNGNGDMVLVTETGEAAFRFRKPLHPLPVGTVQQCLDEMHVQDIDYVHGDEAVRAFVRQGKGSGILVSPMDKRLLFGAVEKEGPLPRKTFSMGEAHEKRYYMECRRIL